MPALSCSIAQSPTCTTTSTGFFSIVNKRNPVNLPDTPNNTNMASPPREAETSLFRPSKKRKIYRQRALDNEEDEDQAATIATNIPPPNVQSLDELIAGASITGEEQAESINLSVAEILRLRKLRSKRAGGVEFRADAPTARAEEENAIVLRQEQEGDAVKQHEGERKFAPQTGTVGDVNKHM